MSASQYDPARFEIQASASDVQQAWRDWTDGWAPGRAQAITVSSDEHSGLTVAVVPTELTEEFGAMMKYRGF